MSQESYATFMKRLEEKKWENREVFAEKKGAVCEKKELGLESYCLKYFYGERRGGGTGREKPVGTELSDIFLY